MQCFVQCHGTNFQGENPGSYPFLEFGAFFFMDERLKLVHGLNWQSSSAVNWSFSGNSEGLGSGRTFLKKCSWNLDEKQTANGCNCLVGPPEGAVCLQLLLCLPFSHSYLRYLSPFALAYLWIHAPSVSVFFSPSPLLEISLHISNRQL